MIAGTYEPSTILDECVAVLTNRKMRELRTQNKEKEIKIWGSKVSQQVRSNKAADRVKYRVTNKISENRGKIYSKINISITLGTFQIEFSRFRVKFLRKFNFKKLFFLNKLCYTFPVGGRGGNKLYQGTMFS